MADSSTAIAGSRLSLLDTAQITAWSRVKKSAATITGRLGRQRPLIDSLLVLAAAVADQAVPEQQKGPGRFKKLTKTILVLFKGKATKYSVMTAADIKSRGPELAAILDHTIFNGQSKMANCSSLTSAIILAKNTMFFTVFCVEN